MSDTNQPDPLVDTVIDVLGDQSHALHFKTDAGDAAAAIVAAVRPLIEAEVRAQIVDEIRQAWGLGPRDRRHLVAGIQWSAIQWSAIRAGRLKQNNDDDCN